MKSKHTEIVQRRQPIGSIEKAERGGKSILQRGEKEHLTGRRLFCGYQEGPEQHNGTTETDATFEELSKSMCLGHNS